MLRPARRPVRRVTGTGRQGVRGSFPPGISNEADSRRPEAACRGPSAGAASGTGRGRPPPAFVRLDLEPGMEETGPFIQSGRESLR